MKRESLWRKIYNIALFNTDKVHMIHYWRLLHKCHCSLLLQANFPSKYSLAFCPTECFYFVLALPCPTDLTLKQPEDSAMLLTLSFDPFQIFLSFVSFV